MARQILRIVFTILKSSVTWLIVLGILSDLGYSWSTRTDTMIERYGVILADIIRMFL